VRFDVDIAVYVLGVRGIYFNIRGMQNRAAEDCEISQFVAEQLARVPGELESSDIIRGFTGLHRKVSSKWKKLKPSPEILLAYVRERGSLPRVNGLVDVYNAISVTSCTAMGAHDLARVSGDIALRLTRGDERFWPIGALEPGKISPGEYAYIDSSNEILCRMEVRQVEKTKITLDTHDAFFIVQAHAQVEWAVVEDAALQLEQACMRFFGGKVERLATLGPG
jgi:DNA/RNA-binding domain of Phe-tRNA-synthetase-like protein